MTSSRWLPAATLLGGWLLGGWLLCACGANSRAAAGSRSVAPSSAGHHPVDPTAGANAKPVVRPAAPLELEAFPAQPGASAYSWVFSKRLQLRIALPDRLGWKMRRGRSQFLAFDHAVSRSTLAISLWTGDENMSPAKCETRARLLRELPRRDQTLASRFLDLPRNFNTQLDVGMAPLEKNAIRGYLLAFGANARRCFAFIYETRAAGDQAEKHVGARLAAMQSITLERLERKSQLTP